MSVVALAYAIACYATFLVAALLFVGFLAGLPLGPTIDAGAVGSVRDAIGIDLALVVAFGVQHSAMARAGFKRLWTRLVPPVSERSTYVLLSSLLLLLLVGAWRSVPAVIWSVEAPVGASALAVLFWVGVAIVIGATFAISHAELTGLERPWARVRGHDSIDAAPQLRTPLLYRVVRHPMQLGFVIVFWATPLMTFGRLLLAVPMTAYVLLGIWLEERDLRRTFGQSYDAYRRRVPRLVPRVPALVLAGGAVAACAALATLGGAARPDRPDAPGLRGDTLTAGGVARAYHVYVPRDGRDTPGVARRRGPRPVVLALHGASGDGTLMRALVGRTLERMADSLGFLVVYPDGWRGTWNDCRRAAPYAAKRAGIDDVAFVRALIGRLAHDGGGDASRVYAIGFSNGGQLALRLVVEAPDLLAGAAVLGAAMPAQLSSECVLRAAPAGARPRVLLVGGTHDAVNPFDGGEVVLPTGVRAGTVLSMDATAEWLAALAGAAEPRRVATARTRADARARVAETTWWRDGRPHVGVLATLGGRHVVGRLAPAAAWLGDDDASLDVAEAAIRFLAPR